MAIRFQAPKEGNHGWYCCTLGTLTKYLHTDGELRDSTYNGKAGKSTGYFDDEQHAMDVLVEYIANNL